MIQNLNIVVIWKEYYCTYLSTSLDVVRNIQSNLATFLRFSPSLIDVKYSRKLMATKFFTYSLVKIFK